MIAESYTLCMVIYLQRDIRLLFVIFNTIFETFLLVNYFYYRIHVQ